MPRRAKRMRLACNTFSASENKLLVKFCHEAPEKFLDETSSETSVLFKTQDPPDISALLGLSKEIWETFTACKQTNEQLTDKLLLWKNFNSYIKSELPEFGLFMAGSTLNGFGLQTSDIDLSLLTTKPVKMRKKICVNQLKTMMRTLLTKCDINSIEIIRAKIPLIRFHEIKSKFNVDIIFNSISNIQGTHLLYCYSQVDWRVSPLVTIVKQWGKTHEILDTRYGSLSSYPLVLMVIHFLQVGVKPRILPSLQKCFKGKFDATVKCIDFLNKIDVPHTELYPTNKQSLGELLLQFFEYFTKFEFNKYVISIREADRILKSEYKNKPGTNYNSGYLFIEEPFSLLNVGQTTVHKSETFEKIKSMFGKTYLRLKTTRNLSDILDKSLK